MDNHRTSHATLHREVRLPPPGEPVRLSRVSSPQLRAEIAGEHPVIEVPAVAGRTVWEYGRRDVVAVVESPNWVGRVEQPASGLRVVSVERTCDPLAVGVATRLSKILVQLPGVSAPWQPVEAPWFTVLLAVDPVPVAALVPGGHALALPELPGGLRVGLPQDASEAGLRQYAAGFAAALTSMREGG